MKEDRRVRRRKNKAEHLASYYDEWRIYFRDGTYKDFRCSLSESGVTEFDAAQETVRVYPWSEIKMAVKDWP